MADSKPILLQSDIQLGENGVFFFTLTKAKEIVKLFREHDPSNKLWNKMLFAVSFEWICENKLVYRRKLEKYKKKLELSYGPKIDYFDAYWLSTYIQIMIEILNHYYGWINNPFIIWPLFFVR